MSVIDIPSPNASSPLATLRGHHVGIRVLDFELSKDWFVEKLDFRVVHTWSYGDMKLAYLAPAEDDNFMLEILGNGTPQPVPKPISHDLVDSLGLAGYHHTCFKVPNVDATIVELRRRGVNIVTEPFVLPVIGSKLAFFSDPFGNLFELMETVA